MVDCVVSSRHIMPLLLVERQFFFSFVPRAFDGLLLPTQCMMWSFDIHQESFQHLGYLYSSQSLSLGDSALSSAHHEAAAAVEA